MKRIHPTMMYFFYFLVFNLCFYGLQLALIVSKNSSFISAVSLPPQIYFVLAATLCAHIVLYLILSLIQTVLLSDILKRAWHYYSAEQWQIIIWSITVCLLLSANANFFPLSVFSKLLSPAIPAAVIRLLFYLSLFAIVVLFINSLFNRRTQYLILGFTPFIIYILLNPLRHEQQNISSSMQNIIILGIDSLNPEHVTPEAMPFLSSLLKQGAQFSNTVSPLARTYPAWTSILTGLYAEHHHAEENLVPKNLVKSDLSIVWALDKMGFNTIYATDDRRFNSIGPEFGFKKIIGPPLGVNDVLLGSFNDFPLSNLIINSGVGARIFPYNYMNRASFFSYYPATFSEQFIYELEQQPSTNPLFLAIHLTLPHWPYAWAVSSPEQLNNEFSVKKRAGLYNSALNRVDKQFHYLYHYLEKNNYFNNSLLIILSDHGEVLYYPGSRLTNYNNYQGQLPGTFAKYLQQNTATMLNKSAGHGSDILSPGQYHCILGWYIYKQGHLITPYHKITTRTALIDIAPTILNFLNVKPLPPMDGISLLSSIKNPLHSLYLRPFFIESGMFPNQDLSKEKTMKIGQEFYDVNPLNGEIEIKAHKLNFFAQQKLYGIIHGDWVLALYPDKTHYVAVIQNLVTGYWSDDLHGDFAKGTPAQSMYQQLVHFYGPKIYLPLP